MAAACTIAVLATTLAGCVTPHTPPGFTIDGVRTTSTSADATVIAFDVTGRNDNEFALPLRQVTYTLVVDGEQVFTGTREALVTLPRFGRQTFTVPAAIETEWLANRQQTGADGATLRATVTYETPGSIAEVLFDANLRRPTARFELGTDLPIDAEPPTAPPPEPDQAPG